MIMADKIIELRNKNNWSQEELAEKLDVSRQSISKWEGAQSIPDMKRIIQMSELFGVSTDFLLKDEMGLETISGKPEEGTEIVTAAVASDDPALEVSTVTMEEATEFLEYKEKESRNVAAGVLMCILSPVMLLLLGGLSEAGIGNIPEAVAAGGGLLALFCLICPAVALFVLSAIRGKRFEYMEKNAVETVYGVDGMVRSRKDRFAEAYTRMLVTGIVFCVASAVPMFVALMVFGEGNGNGSITDELPYVFAVCTLLIMVSVGVFLIVRASIIQGGYQMILEEGDYTRSEKQNARRNEAVTAAYWIIVTALFLGYSFITNEWHRSWIIWPVAGVLYGLVIIIANALRKKN